MNVQSEEAKLRDRLIGALIGLARATDGNEHLICDSSTGVIVESLLAALAKENTPKTRLEELLKRVEDEKRKMVPDCFVCAAPCGRTNDYDMQELLSAPEDIRSMKINILLAIRDLAAHRNEAADSVFYRALIALGMDGFGVAELRSILNEVEAARGAAG